MNIRLLVLRTGSPEKTVAFYGLLGFIFDYHKHGNSPYHYTTQIGETILEIYPFAKNQTEADKNLRLGFAIDDFDRIINTLKKHQVTFVLEPAQTDFGFMAIIIDPDDRKIELYKK